MEEEEERPIEGEFMVLKSIFEEEIQAKRNQSENIDSVEITLFPATANDVDIQYVKLQLRFEIPLEYPLDTINIVFVTSRGLSDARLVKLKTEMEDYVSQSQGETVLYNLIQMVQDNLTSNNLPCTPCPICLSSFMELDDFLKTECFHYMHSYCMYQYVQNFLKQNKQTPEALQQHIQKRTSNTMVVKEVPCPVCRLQIGFDMDALKQAHEPLDSEPIDINWSTFKNEVDRMRQIFRHQKNNGGLIDKEAEKNKHLLSSIEQAYATSTQKELERAEQEQASKAKQDLKYRDTSTTNQLPSKSGPVPQSTNTATNSGSKRHQHHLVSGKPNHHNSRPNSRPPRNYNRRPRYRGPQRDQKTEMDNSQGETSRGPTNRGAVVAKPRFHFKSSHAIRQPISKDNVNLPNCQTAKPNSYNGSTEMKFEQRSTSQIRPPSVYRAKRPPSGFS